MSLLLASLLIFLMAKRQNRFFWLALPLSLVFDFWWSKPLGCSGMGMIALLLVFWWFFPSPKTNKYKNVI